MTAAITGRLLSIYLAAARRMRRGSRGRHRGPTTSYLQTPKWSRR